VFIDIAILLFHDAEAIFASVFVKEFKLEGNILHKRLRQNLNMIETMR